MDWTIEFTESALKQLKKIDKAYQRKILRFLRERIATNEDPERFGKPLLDDKKGLWRYRVEDHRIICRIEKEKVVVLILGVGHRGKVYSKH